LSKQTTQIPHDLAVDAFIFIDLWEWCHYLCCYKDHLDMNGFPTREALFSDSDVVLRKCRRNKLKCNFCLWKKYCFLTKTIQVALKYVPICECTRQYIALITNKSLTVVYIKTIQTNNSCISDLLNIHVCKVSLWKRNITLVCLKYSDWNYAILLIRILLEPYISFTLDKGKTRMLGCGTGGYNSLLDQQNNTVSIINLLICKYGTRNIIYCEYIKILIKIIFS